jgi:predicted phosphodiesterase
MKNFENYFKKKWTSPVRNSCGASKPAGIVLGANPAAEQRAFAAPKWLRPRSRGIISNGVKGLLLSGMILLASFPSYAGSIREVSQSIKQVRSIELPFHFTIIGDSRSGDKVYIQLLKRILERNPQFLIHLGDMINIPHEKEWQGFFEISEQIELPFFPVVGNHDVGTTSLGEEIYCKQFSLLGGKTYYAFRTGDILFVILDSEKGRGRIIKEQWSWLEDILSSSKETFKLVFIHRPLFPPMDSLKMGRAMDRYSLERDDLHQLFLKTKVKAVFAGDDHRYDRREKDGILYLISGGGGAPLTSFKERGGYFHYVWISVQKGRIEGEVVDVDGQIQDTFVIE